MVTAQTHIPPRVTCGCRGSTHSRSHTHILPTDVVAPPTRSRQRTHPCPCDGEGSMAERHWGEKHSPRCATIHIQADSALDPPTAPPVALFPACPANCLVTGGLGRAAEASPSSPPLFIFCDQLADCKLREINGPPEPRWRRAESGPRTFLPALQLCN